MQTLAATEKMRNKQLKFQSIRKRIFGIGKLNPDQDEILVLRGMFRTLKVAKILKLIE